MESLKRENQKKPVSPDALKLVMLDEIAGRLADITEIQQKIFTHLIETTPEGIDIPLSEKTVTDIATIDLIKEYPYRPLRSIDFFNKGPNTAYYRINNDAKEVPIEDREILKAERPKATIEYVTLRVASGESATIKMTGHI